MTRFQRWILKKIAKRIVWQGRHHEENITEYYRIMNEAATREFYEDNWQTLQSVLRDCQERASIYSFPSPEGVITIVEEK